MEAEAPEEAEAEAACCFVWWTGGEWQLATQQWSSRSDLAESFAFWATTDGNDDDERDGDDGDIKYSLVG